MSKYGEAAIEAERLRLKDNTLKPVEAWEKAINQTSLSNSSRKKCCPKLAYVGVCESKMNIQPDRSKNKNYAREAVIIIRKSKPSSAAELWRQVKAKLKCKKHLAHNGQMDVVISLDDAGLL